MFGSLPTRLAATVVKKVLKIFATVFFIKREFVFRCLKPIHFALLFNLVKPRDFTAFHMSVDEFLHSKILL